MNGPVLTLRPAGAISTSTRVYLYGTNLMEGDKAKWVRPDATSCSSEFDVFRSEGVIQEADGSASRPKLGTHAIPLW